MDSSISLRVACNLSPGMASTSVADLRYGCDVGETIGVDIGSESESSPSKSGASELVSSQSMPDSAGDEGELSSAASESVSGDSSASSCSVSQKS